MAAAGIIALVLMVYAGVGLIFGLWFVAAGLERIDPGARGAAWGFRLIVLPGVAALWPLLALRVWRGPR